MEFCFVQQPNTPTLPWARGTHPCFSFFFRPRLADKDPVALDHDDAVFTGQAGDRTGGGVGRCSAKEAGRSALGSTGRFPSQPTT